MRVDLTTNDGVKKSLLDNPDLVLDYELGGRESQNTKNIFVKKNEPGCYGIGSDRIGDFNEQVTKIEVYDAKTKKRLRKQTFLKTERIRINYLLPFAQFQALLYF